MLKGLWSLTWLEIKIFVREPLGLVGTVGVPVAIVMFLGRVVPPATRVPMTPRGIAAGTTVTVLVALLIALNAVLSLVTIIAIYREGGILKRLRATPLRSHTILTAHVLVKLLFTGLTLLLTLLAGARTHPAILDGRLIGFVGALFITTVSLLSHSSSLYAPRYRPGSFGGIDGVHGGYQVAAIVLSEMGCGDAGTAGDAASNHGGY